MFEPHHDPFGDGRGRFPDKICINAPRGFRDLARQAAALEGVSLAEFVRRRLYEAVSDRTAADGCARKFGTADG
jgi:hypothetical protein